MISYSKRAAEVQNMRVLKFAEILKRNVPFVFEFENHENKKEIEKLEWQIAVWRNEG